MRRRGKRKRAFVFALQVWLTSAFVGSLVTVGIIASVFSRDFQSGDLMVFPEVLGIALLYSSYCFLLLWAGVFYINRSSLSLTTRKWVIALGSLMLSFFVFIWTFVWPDPSQRTFPWTFFAAYTVPLLAAIFIFRWPRGGGGEVMVEAEEGAGM